MGAAVTHTNPVGARPRPRRGALAARRMMTVLVVLALFGGIGYTVWRVSLAAPAGAGEPPVCVTPKPVALALPPRSVVVNVYNATNRTGLAARTATQLARYGFRIGKVDNDPLRRPVRGTAEVRGGPASTRQITVVQAYVDKETVYRVKRKGATIDLVLGARFTGLGGPATRTKPTGPGC
jgi:LytR cell envelope-related transcriptional attenuator